ncbi:TIGR01244 family sulfur transferase [Methylobacterium sp. sgz302541]|uniref:TIGR01244 family sulfur transferase n=1 Tax=unclassified Methylobacterium TaxID=2615210 RepID=UPI003D34C178
MEAKRLDRDLSVTEQVAPSDLADAARAGFRAVICNRPDGEGADQPNFSEIEAAARAAGLEARYLPVESGKVSDGDAAAFDAALSALPKPVLAYCRTGTRSATLWSLSEGAKGRPLPEILSATKAAGYDMNGAARRIAAGGRISAADAAADLLEGHAQGPRVDGQAAPGRQGGRLSGEAGPAS